MNKNFGSGFESVDLAGEVIDWEDFYEDDVQLEDWDEYHQWLIESQPEF